MASEELISSYLDRAGIKADTDFFLANLKAVIDAYANLSGTKVNLSFSEGIKASSTYLNQLNENLKQTSAASQQASQSLTTQSKTVKDLSGNYQDLVKASVQNEIAAKALREQRQLLNKDFKDSKITQEQYAAGLESVKVSENELKVSNEQLSRAMKNLEKDSQAAEGSLDKLRAILNISLQAYDALSAEEKNSDIGKGVIKNIQDLTKEISEQEQATGRFQRSVGNYTGALQPLEKELQRVREELQKTKTAQESLIQSGPAIPSSNQNRNTSTGTRGPQAGDIQAVANYNSQLQQTNATVAELEKQEQLLNNIVTTQSRGFTSATAEIRSLERALFTMQEQGLATTEAFKDIQEKLAEAKREMREFKETQKLLSAEIPGIAAMSLAIKGISGAYAVGAGAAAIFADGNEKVEKELNKLVAIMTVLQGLQEVHELLEKKNTVAKIAGVVATNISATAQRIWTATMLSSTVATVAFRTALIAVTGGLILLLPLAISAFSAMADAAEDAQRSQELLNEVNKKSIDGYAEETIQIDLAIKKLQDENLTRDDKAKIIDDLQHKYPEYLGNIKNEGALTEELSKAIKDKLIPALELEAKAKAAQQLATEKYKKILELQNEAIESGSTGLAYIQESLGAFLNNTTLMAKGNVKALQNTGDEINKLQKDLDGYLAIILDASDAVKKLGGGDPTGIKTTIINITKEIEARAKLIELIKQQQIELTKPASDNSENPEIFRLRALEKGYELEKQIITNRLNTSLQLNTIELEKIKHDLNERLTTEKHNAQEIADLNAQAASDERALLYQRKQLVLQTNDELYNADITYNIVRGKIHAYTLQQIVDEEKMSSEQIADYDKKKMDAELKAEQDHIKKRQDQDAINQDTELRVLDIEYQKKLIDEDEYQKKKFEIEKYYSLKSQADTITDLEKQIQKAKEAGQSTLDLERKIADEKRKIDDDLTKKLIDNRDKLVAREKEFANTVIGAVQSLVDNGYERQKNAIQDQINLVDTKKQKEIDAVNASLNTEEKKAAQIAIINARADDQKTQLEKKQREQDIKKAQFDKLIGILQVGISTQRTIADLASKAAIAKAEAAVLAANPVTAAYAPIAFASAAAIAAQIPLALAQGAIQAGLIAAQPIPKYRTGTGDHPGGLMWAGDGGKSEIVIRPDGNAFVTPSVSTLYDMPRGTIVLPDADQAIEQSFNMMYKPLLPAMAGGGDAQVKMLSKKMDAVISAINGIPGTKVINTWSGVNTSYENVSRQWEYINRNTQS